VTIDEALTAALAEASSSRADLLTHAVRATEPRRPLEPLGRLCGPRAIEHAMLGAALYRLRPPGTGLTRMAVRERTPAWVPSIADAAGFARRTLLTRWGVQSGAAVPVMAGNRVAAVIEVLSFERLDRDEAMEALFDRLAAMVRRAAVDDAAQAAGSSSTNSLPAPCAGRTLMSPP